MDATPYKSDRFASTSSRSAASDTGTSTQSPERSISYKLSSVPITSSIPPLESEQHHAALVCALAEDAQQLEQRGVDLVRYAIGRLLRRINFPGKRDGVIALWITGESVDRGIAHLKRKTVSDPRRARRDLDSRVEPSLISALCGEGRREGVGFFHHGTLAERYDPGAITPALTRGGHFYDMPTPWNRS